MSILDNTKIFGIHFQGIKDKMYHWSVTLSYKDRKFTTEVYSGLGNTIKRERFIQIDPSCFLLKDLSKEEKIMVAKACLPYGKKATVYDVEDCEYAAKLPELNTILDCLKTDCHAGSYLLFEDYCSEFSEDEDSRKAEKLWRFCQEVRGNLLKFFGSDFEMFMETNFDE